jgi:hypothetical protein
VSLLLKGPAVKHQGNYLALPPVGARRRAVQENHRKRSTRRSRAA